MLTVTLVLGLAALILAIASASTGRVPLWVAVVLLAIIVCLHAMPLR